MLFGIFGLPLGLGLGLWFPGYFPESISAYVGIMLVACADSIIGGLRARALGDYNESVFFSGFFINALLAAGMTYFGQCIDLELEIAAMVVFATRIFQNLAILRRSLLNLNEK